MNVEYSVEMNEDEDRAALPWVTAFRGHALRAFATKFEAENELTRINGLAR